MHPFASSGHRHYSTRMAIRTPFDQDALAEFLRSGWLLSLDADWVLLGWGDWRESSSPPDERNSCAVYAPDFYLKDERPWKWTAHWDRVDRNRFASLVLTGLAANVNSDMCSKTGALASPKHEKIRWLEPQLEFFENAWKAIDGGFSERGLQKAVPVVFSRANEHFGPGRRLTSLAELVGQPTSLYLYGMWSETSGLIGASPELLFSWSGAQSDCLETMALAGTRAKGSGLDAIILLKDPKERFEHQLVVDDLKERLSQIGDVMIGPIEVLELPTLLHLQTRIQARPRSALSFESFVRHMHPTPALGVSPRRLGFEEMRRWDDPEMRGRFGAPFGAQIGAGDDLEAGQLHCIVAIRNVQWDGDRIKLGSGCGIVGESRLEREWKELSLKRESVKKALHL